MPVSGAQVGLWAFWGPSLPRKCLFWLSESVLKALQESMIWEWKIGMSCWSHIHPSAEQRAFIHTPTTAPLSSPTVCSSDLPAVSKEIIASSYSFVSSSQIKPFVSNLSLCSTCFGLEASPSDSQISMLALKDSKPWLSPQLPSPQVETYLFTVINCM